MSKWEWLAKRLAFAMFAMHAVAVPAAAPMAKAQPGFFRMMLGDYEITALNDGVVVYPVNRILPSATAVQIKDGLFENGLTDPVGLSYNA
jgi:hypothetical protein